MINCTAIKNRKSVRLYDRSRKIQTELLYNCIEAASKAPSPFNIQPWRFKLITSQNEIKRIGEMLINNKWVCAATALIVIGMKEESNIDDRKLYMAMGAAIENILLEAQHTGISTCWIGEALDISEKIENIIEWDKNYLMLSIVALGYERKFDTKRTMRKGLNEIII